MTILQIEQGEHLKSGDTEPDLIVQLRNDNSVPYTLDSHEVSLYIKEVGGESLVIDDDTSGNVSIDDEANGIVSYSWQSGDTDKAATYVGEVEVETLDGGGNPTGEIATFPSQGYFKVRVQESLD